MEKVCTFFGHRDCCGLDAEVLRNAIEDLIKQGVVAFYVGNHGQFDRMVHSCLKQLRKEYPDIFVAVVLACIPKGKRGYWDTGDTMYPEIEGQPKFARMAKRRGLQVINLGSAAID